MTPLNSMTDRLSSRCWLGRAPAKVNLFFEILGKRPDGYHDVCSLCCPVSLYDTLIFEPTDEPGVTLTCKPGRLRQTVCDIPTDEGNIVVRAVEHIRQHYGITAGCRIRLIKRIPSQAGMGGGSSDAATAIRLASEAWNLRLSAEEMKTIGAALGSDVPLFFFNGMSLGYGRGERVEPVESRMRLDFVILKPVGGISTAEAFRQCAAHRTTDDNNEEESRQLPDQLIQGLREGDPRRMVAGLFNRLEGTARDLFPPMREIREFFARQDCPGHQMTGSGTAYFAVCRHEKQARLLAERVRQRYPAGDVFVVHSLVHRETRGQ